MKFLLVKRSIIIKLLAKIRLPEVVAKSFIVTLQRAIAQWRVEIWKYQLPKNVPGNHGHNSCIEHFST